MANPKRMSVRRATRVDPSKPHRDSLLDEGIFTLATLSEVSWVDRIMTQYATCASYTDRGTVYFRSEVSGRFETAFVRDGERLSFDYEWIHPTDQAATLRATGARCLATWNGKESGRPTHSEVAKLTGVTFGAGHFGPRHLMPDHVTGRPIAAARVLAEGELTLTLLDGTELYLIDRATLTVKRFGNTVARPNPRMLREFAMSDDCREYFSTLVTYDAVTIIPAR
jgi:hypothetical protein